MTLMDDQTHLNEPCQCMPLQELLQFLPKTDTLDQLLKHFGKVVERYYAVTALSLMELRTIREDKTDIYIAIPVTNITEKIHYIREGDEMRAIVERKALRISKSSNEKIYFAFYDNEDVTHLLILDCVEFCGDWDYLEMLLATMNSLVKLYNRQNRDFLTGLPNRQSMNRVFHEEMYESATHHRKYSHCAIADIDHFKSINDNFGHVMGDEVLVLFSRVIVESLRREDRVFRFGGEEFVMLLRETEKDEIMDVMERLRKNVADFSFPQVGHVTVSIGVASIEGEDPFLVLDRSDRALYYSKNNGRNRVYSYEDLRSSGKISDISRASKGVHFW